MCGHILQAPHRSPASSLGCLDFELGDSSLGLGLTSLWEPAARRVLRGGSVASGSCVAPRLAGTRISPPPASTHTALLEGLQRVLKTPSHPCCHLRAGRKASPCVRVFVGLISLLDSLEIGAVGSKRCPRCPPMPLRGLILCSCAVRGLCCCPHDTAALVALNQASDFVTLIFSHVRVQQMIHFEARTPG